jgi:CheY-like chemotaxis protein
MKKRIYRVLLVCSNYDFFMLEEDGRIDEQIFNEYTALSIRFPPVFIQADSARKAFEIIQSYNIDLVILMLNIGDTEPFELAHQIKQQYQNVPIVVLTHFSREVSLRLQNEDLSAIDYVFCWLGNADLLLAIIKLIEDRMNAEHDILQVGVQSIMFVEDSVRYISQILPNLYKIIIRQSHDFMQEGLNEHQKMLRLRGRPKILIAKTYDEARELYLKYGHHMIGIISDISFKKSSRQDAETREGLLLCKMVRKEDPFMPFLMQSSDISNEKYACELNTGFIHKLSKTLSLDLRNYVINNFGFGDLIFRDPQTFQEVVRVSDLQDLQNLILKIPDNVLSYHAGKNEISKWLNARALFPLGRLFKILRIEDFENLESVRAYIFDAISNYRLSTGMGVIATFDKKSFDEYLAFSRIGEGSLGGKARGLAFIDTVIKKHKLFNKINNVLITIPRTVVVSTDLFDEFMETNRLYKIALSDVPDEEILKSFVKAELPNKLMQDLVSFSKGVEKPVAVRSSSKLEDSHYQPFAGVYSTYMIPLVPGDSEATARLISEAIKCVYASVYYKSSKAYIAATSNFIDEEKMGIILEEVCGCAYGNHYYPAMSGVARSINFYPINPEKSEEGIAIIAYGLGKYIVEGGTGLRFSPMYPKKVLQLSSPEMALKETQKYFYALNLDPSKWIPSVDDKVNLLKLKIDEAEDDISFRYAGSTFDRENNKIVDGLSIPGKRVVTFSNVLNYNVFPLHDILQALLEIGQKEMNNPIEIEFAVGLDRPKGQPFMFNFLQIRPIVESDQGTAVKIDQVKFEETIVYSDSALGNGNFQYIADLIYVRPENFTTSETYVIAEEIEKINSRLREEKRNYILAGPGRWGSTDAKLGIPVKWWQISEARIIIEAGMENYRVDPSQGTHFFQNITSFRVGYMTVNSFINEGFLDREYLKNYPAYYESSFLRHLRFKNPLNIKIDGRHNKGVIFKPLK